MRALGIAVKKVIWAATLAAICVLPAIAQQDPPSRVARLNHIEGNVSMEPAGVDDWVPAVINHPFTLGDYLYTDQGARAELHLDIAAMRMGALTSFGFLNLNDQAVQIKLSEGDMYFRLHHFSPNQVFEVDTPNAAVTLLSNGIYRFRVDPNGNMSFIVVRQGQAQVTGGGQAFTLTAGNSAMITGTDQLSYDVEVAPAPDDFDNWCAQRDAHEAHLASARYLPPTVIGYEDLDDYGGWETVGEYGPVWYPRQVAVGWAPYHDGHWAWVDPWGWTWVDDAPWGFAPFHYGRWAYIGTRWGWCPGPIVVGYRGPVVRPYYAPALVAWFGGSHWGVSVSVGGPSLGWVALGFGEVFTPPYVCSRGYFTNVNVYNTRVVERVNITNVYNTVYVNHAVYNREYVNVRAPGAVIAMRQDAFAGGRAVREGGFAVRQADVTRIQTAAVITPGVAPTRQALAPTMGRFAAHPSPQIVQRPVVARNTPPAAPAPFAARQQYLQQHAGDLHNFQAMHQAVAPQARPVAFVRPAPAAQPVAVHPGQRVGNVAAFRAQGPMNQQPGRPPMTANQRGPVAAAVQSQPQTAAAHGTPPNVRPSYNGEPAGNAHFPQRPGEAGGQSQGQNPRFTERTPQAAQPNQPGFTERTQAGGQPQPQNQRFTERTPQPAQPNQPRFTERTQAGGQPQPQNQRFTERTPQPPPARPEARPVERTPQPPPARAAERTQPPPRETRPAPAPQEHRTPPPTPQKGEKEKDTKEHR